MVDNGPRVPQERWKPRQLSGKQRWQKLRPLSLVFEAKPGTTRACGLATAHPPVTCRRHCTSEAAQEMQAAARPTVVQNCNEAEGGARCALLSRGFRVRHDYGIHAADTWPKHGSSSSVASSDLNFPSIHTHRASRGVLQEFVATRVPSTLPGEVVRPEWLTRKPEPGQAITSQSMLL